MAVFKKQVNAITSGQSLGLNNSSVNKSAVKNNGVFNRTLFLLSLFYLRLFKVIYIRGEYP